MPFWQLFQMAMKKIQNLYQTEFDFFTNSDFFAHFISLQRFVRERREEFEMCVFEF